MNEIARFTTPSLWFKPSSVEPQTSVRFSLNQKIRVYGRNSRGSSYYIYAPTLVIVET